MRKLFSMLTATVLSLGLVAQSYAADEKKPERTPEEAFKAMDKDGDGSLTEAEFVGKREGEKATKAKEQFGKLDKNKDGKVSLEEMKARGEKKPK